MDGTRAQLGSKTIFLETLQCAKIRYYVSHPKIYNENTAEAYIRKIKKIYFKIQENWIISNQLCNRGISWICNIVNLMARSSIYEKVRPIL